MKYTKINIAFGSVLIGAAALVVLLVAQAGIKNLGFEPESGSKRGVDVVADSAASGNSFVQFGSQQQWTPMSEIDITKSYGSDSIIGAGQNGSIRVVCLTSHFNYDDPILHPGRPGAAHLHMFWGNTLTDAYSTLDSLIDTGHGTCQGNEVNRTGYWIPALIDRDNNARIPRYYEIYYKRGAVHAPIDVMPNGLTMIVGNAAANGPGENLPSYQAGWACGTPQISPRSAYTSLIPDCGAGRGLSLKLLFPQCWDGRNLTAPDYISHLAYPSNGFCPSTHPNKIPEITYNVYWENPDQNSGGWHLSSDIRDDRILPGGSTTHGDWMGAWNPEILQIMKNGCFNAAHDCKGGTIAPGKRFVGTSAPGVLSNGKIPVSSIPRP